jgi:hypothetical protein
MRVQQMTSNAGVRREGDEKTTQMLYLRFYGDRSRIDATRCLTVSDLRHRIIDGGSRKGSKGNAVRARFDVHNAAAAPATVSGESPADLPLRVTDALGKAA